MDQLSSSLAETNDITYTHLISMARDPNLKELSVSRARDAFQNLDLDECIKALASEFVTSYD